ncbi:MAG TPA: hypothetical protein VEU08_13565 [Vicinamibacterales bacterium]|nr:hypothetical protein [Vicinamibacterales bacterium]
MIAAALALSLLLAQAAESTTIVLSDDAVSMPARIPSGITLFAVENSGSAPHDLRFVKIGAGHTVDEFKAWKESGKPIPEWLVSSGGMGAIGPAAKADYRASLAPGSYVAISDDKRFAPVQVTTARGPAPAQPEADLTVRLHDHGFQLTAPVPSGRPLFHVQNTGSEPHQMLIVRLPDGANEFQQRAWISSGSRGSSPGEQYGGILELAAGAEAWFRTPLKPGRYLLICGELEEEGRHFDLGMIYRFEVE